MKKEKILGRIKTKHKLTPKEIKFFKKELKLFDEIIAEIVTEYKIDIIFQCRESIVDTIKRGYVIRLEREENEQKSNTRNR